MAVDFGPLVTRRGSAVALPQLWSIWPDQELEGASETSEPSPQRVRGKSMYKAMLSSAGAPVCSAISALRNF